MILSSSCSFDRPWTPGSWEPLERSWAVQTSRAPGARAPSPFWRCLVEGSLALPSLQTDPGPPGPGRFHGEAMWNTRNTMVFGGWNIVKYDEIMWNRQAGDIGIDGDRLRRIPDRGPRFSAPFDSKVERTSTCRRVWQEQRNNPEQPKGLWNSLEDLKHFFMISWFQCWVGPLFFAGQDGAFPLPIGLLQNLGGQVSRRMEKPADVPIHWSHWTSAVSKSIFPKFPIG